MNLRTNIVVTFLHLVGAILMMQTATAQSQSSRGLSMYDVISGCAAGADIELSADIEGSLRELFNGDGAQGQASVSTRTEWLQNFAEKDRIEAAKLYHACIEQSLGILIPPFDPDAEFLSRMAFECRSIDRPTQDVFFDGRIQQRGAPSGISFENLVGDFYIGRDQNLYTRSASDSTFIAHTPLTAIEIEQQRQEYHRTNISLDVSVFLRFDSFLDINESSAAGVTVNRIFVVFIDRFSRYVWVVEEDIVLSTGRLIKARAIHYVANCRRF